MALLFCDNFENWSSIDTDYPGPWLNTTGSWGNGIAGSNVNSYKPGYFYPASGVPISGYLVFGFANKSTIICNFKATLGPGAGGTENTWILLISAEGTTQTSLHHQTNGRLGLWRGNETAFLGESTSVFAFDENIELDIELKITIHNSTGAAELRVNGVTEFNLSGLDTASTANNFSDTIWLGKYGFGDHWAKTAPTYKHFILMDTTGSVMNDFIGPVAVSSLRPSADGNYTTWVANTGDRWDAVNEAVTDADTSYVHADGAAEKVSFAMTDLPAGVTDIYGVLTQAQVKRETDTTRISQMFVRAGGTDQSIGSAIGVGPAYAFRNAVVTLNPHTAAAWTPAEINALELGMEIIT